MSQDTEAKEPFKCPHCGNSYGFVCGTCCSCGWNHLSHKFDWVRVYVDHLEPGQAWLIDRHARFTRSP